MPSHSLDRSFARGTKQERFSLCYRSKPISITSQCFSPIWLPLISCSFVCSRSVWVEAILIAFYLLIAFFLLNSNGQKKENPLELVARWAFVWIWDCSLISSWLSFPSLPVAPLNVSYIKEVTSWSTLGIGLKPHNLLKNVLSYYREKVFSWIF